MGKYKQDFKYLLPGKGYEKKGIRAKLSITRTGWFVFNHQLTSSLKLKADQSVLFAKRYKYYYLVLMPPVDSPVFKLRPFPKKNSNDTCLKLNSKKLASRFFKLKEPEESKLIYGVCETAIKVEGKLLFRLIPIKKDSTI